MSPGERPRLRVLFVLPFLAGGGAERTVVTLIHHLDRSRFDARIGLLQAAGPLLDAVPPASIVLPSRGQGWVDYTKAERSARLLAAIPLAPLQQLSLLRSFRPHIVVSLTKSMNLAAFAAVRLFGRRRTRWVLREGNNTMTMLEHEVRGSAGRSAARTFVRFVYSGADRVLTSSRGVAAGLSQRLGIPHALLTTIYNPIDLDRIRELAQDSAACAEAPGFVLAAGRLEVQKGFDVLIRAFARGPVQRGPRLVILGEGPEREALQRLAAHEGVAQQVALPGFVANPWAYMRRAAMFVLPSRWEGFGCVITEAMACEIPVVVTDCHYGPSEIVRHEESGLVVPTEDPDALAQAMLRVMESRGEAAAMAARGAQRAHDFDARQIAAEYEQFFTSLAS